MTKTAETALKLLESLPEEAQEKVIAEMRLVVQELNDELKWDELFKRKKEGLGVAARRAREEIAAGKARPMDLSDL